MCRQFGSACQWFSSLLLLNTMHGIPAHSAVLQEDPSHATIVVYRTHPAAVSATAVVQRWASVADAGPA